MTREEFPLDPGFYFNRDKMFDDFSDYINYIRSLYEGEEWIEIDFMDLKGEWSVSALNYGITRINKDFVFGCCYGLDFKESTFRLEALPDEPEKNKGEGLRWRFRIAPEKTKKFTWPIKIVNEIMGHTSNDIWLRLKRLDSFQNRKRRDGAVTWLAELDKSLGEKDRQIQDLQKRILSLEESKP